MTRARVSAYTFPHCFYAFSVEQQSAFFKAYSKHSYTWRFRGYPAFDEVWNNVDRQLYEATAVLLDNIRMLVIQELATK